jgi:hypothetical protein
LMENDCEEVRMWNKKLRNAAYGPGYEACGWSIPEHDSEIWGTALKSEDQDFKERNNIVI